MRIVVLVRRLVLAGAERQAMLVARRLVERGHAVNLVLLQDDAGFGDDLRAAGAEVTCLRGFGVRDAPRTVWRLVRLLRRWRPDALYGLMDGPNVLVATVGKVAIGARRVAGLRASALDPMDLPRVARLLHRVEPLLCRSCDVVIANSEAGRVDAVERGFPASRVVVVPNGVEVEALQRDPALGEAFRREIGAGVDDLLVGRIGRFHPMKGWPELLDALATTRAKGVRFRVVCVGEGPDRQVIIARAAALGLDDVISWLAPRPDLLAVYSALDVLVSSSRYGEGLPNVVAEAMACEVPCIVTDVGDSADLVGTTGQVVPPGDPDALASALVDLLCTQHRRELGSAARQRIVASYSASAMVATTERHLLGVD